MQLRLMILRLIYSRASQETPQSYRPRSAELPSRRRGLRKARTFINESIALRQEIGDAASARILAAEGQPQEAATGLDIALATARRLGLVRAEFELRLAVAENGGADADDLASGVRCCHFPDTEKPAR